ncbi:MAG: CapA family protein [bacterium]
MSKPNPELSAKVRNLNHQLSPKRHWWLIFGGLLFILVTGTFVWFYFHGHTQEAPGKQTNIQPILYYSIEKIESTQQPFLQKQIETYASARNSQAKPSKPNLADIVLKPSDSTATTDAVQSSQPTIAPLVSGTILKIEPTSGITIEFNNQLKKNSKDDLIALLKPTYDKPADTWTYLALGDVIPARDVYTVSKRSGYTYPFLKIADRTKQADLTVSNLETTVADGQANGEGAGMMVFTAPEKALEGLVSAGIDGVNLANNHSTNGGAAKSAVMLDNLAARSIGSFGVGKTSSASRAWTTTVKGIKITHLGYDSVPGMIDASPTSAGAKRIALKPWGTLSADDITAIQADIKTAKQSADVVIPWFHWGTEYTHDANDEQRRLAQACVDAGADVVIGTHPHWTQGFEWYKDHLIAYSLGNFVFDQNWSEETKRSVALELTFTGSKVTGAQLLPANIESAVQPRFLTSNEALYKQILTDISAHSWWK